MSGRIDTIDTCRGLMLLLMTMTHLLNLVFYTLSPIRPYIYGPFGFFTDPEGFFFLSGFVIALVYGKPLLEGKEALFRQKILSRARQLYLSHISLFAGLILCIGFSSFFENLISLPDPTYFSDEKKLFFFHHPFQALGLGSIFLFQPWFMDLLPLYIYFLLLTPLILRQLVKGRYFPVILASFSLWLYNTCFPERWFLETAEKLHPHLLFNFFNPCAWQILYVLGLVFGSLKLTGRLPRLSQPLVILSASLTLLFFFLKHLGTDFPLLTDLHNLGPLRILNFAAVAYTIWAFHKYVHFSPLALLGRCSLQVFTYHVVLAYALLFFRQEINTLPLVYLVTLFILSTLTIWIPALLVEYRKTLQRDQKILIKS